LDETHLRYYRVYSALFKINWLLILITYAKYHHSNLYTSVWPNSGHHRLVKLTLKWTSTRVKSMACFISQIIPFIPTMLECRQIPVNPLHYRGRIWLDLASILEFEGDINFEFCLWLWFVLCWIKFEPNPPTILAKFLSEKQNYSNSNSCPLWSAKLRVENSDPIYVGPHHQIVSSVKFLLGGLGQVLRPLLWSWPKFGHIEQRLKKMFCSPWGNAQWANTTLGDGVAGTFRLHVYLCSVFQEHTPDQEFIWCSVWPGGISRWRLLTAAFSWFDEIIPSAGAIALSQMARWV
jgi:hypothetical protein